MPRPRQPRALPTPLAPLVDHSPPPHAHELWHELSSRRTRRLRESSVRARAWFSVAACFVVLLGSSLALSAGFRLPGTDDRALLTAGQRPLPLRLETQADYRAFDLSDGSRITVARSARLDVLETSPRTVSLALRSGRVRFDVRPHGPRSWRIDCGAFSVEVVGTKFVLDRDAAMVRVRVLHGAVLVRGQGIPDGVQRLNAGQSLRSPLRPVEPPPRSDAPVVMPIAEEPASQEPAAQEPALEAAQASAPREPRSAAAEPAAESVEEAPQPAVVETSARRRARAVSSAGDEVERLFRDADRARLEGRVQDAVVALSRILARYADDSRAALAGFALGRLQLTATGEPARAAENFKLALSLGLPAALSEDAYGKLAEAYEKAGDHAAACAAWGDYVRRFPRGAKVGRAARDCQVDSPR